MDRCNVNKWSGYICLLFKLQRMDATLTNGRVVYALLFKLQRMDVTLTNGRVIYAMYLNVNG